MIDFWFKTENEQVTDEWGAPTNQPRFPDAWSVRSWSAHQMDDGSWVVRVYLPRDAWTVSIPSYGEHLSDTGSATRIANTHPNDWTAEEVNQSFSLDVESTHYEPRDV